MCAISQKAENTSRRLRPARSGRSTTPSGRLRSGHRSPCSECLWERPAGLWAGPSTSSRQRPETRHVGIARLGAHLGVVRDAQTDVHSRAGTDRDPVHHQGRRRGSATNETDGALDQLVRLVAQSLERLPVHGGEGSRASAGDAVVEGRGRPFIRGSSAADPSPSRLAGCRPVTGATGQQAADQLPRRMPARSGFRNWAAGCCQIRPDRSQSVMADCPATRARATSRGRSRRRRAAPPPRRPGAPARPAERRRSCWRWPPPRPALTARRPARGRYRSSTRARRCSMRV